MPTLPKRLKESVIQKRVTDYAKTKGLMVMRFRDKGLPDRLLVGNSQAFFIEFKKLGAKPSKFQARMIEKIRAAGLAVYVIDDVEQGKRIIDKHNAATPQE